MQPRGKNVGGAGNPGQYAATDMTRLCECGHVRGVHAAARPHDCFGEDGGGTCDKDCVRFRAARRAR